MPPTALYSIRMHAVRGGGHLSGAERLAPAEGVESLAAELVRRALEHPRGRADALRLTVEAVPPEEVLAGRLPDVTTVRVPDWRTGREAARSFLLEAGVAPAAADAAVAALAAGASPEGRSMRGAMLVDAGSGARLEADPARGVRASRMDLAAGAEASLRKELSRRGLDNPHVREALVLAAKVAAAPGVVAELCWSDDPGYTAGYVCSPLLGYVRFPHLKPAGDERGGRAFFLRPEWSDISSTVAYLEKAVVLFDRIGDFRPDREWEG